MIQIYRFPKLHELPQFGCCFRRCTESFLGRLPFDCNANSRLLGKDMSISQHPIDFLFLLVRSVSGHSPAAARILNHVVHDSILPLIEATTS